MYWRNWFSIFKKAQCIEDDETQIRYIWGIFEETYGLEISLFWRKKIDGKENIGKSTKYYAYIYDTKNITWFCDGTKTSRLPHIVKLTSSYLNF